MRSRALRTIGLDTRAWRALRWRQDHLPAARLRRPPDWQALFRIPGCRPAFLNITAGWGMRLRNRQANLRYRWFRLRTLRHYRGAPTLWRPGLAAR